VGVSVDGDPGADYFSAPISPKEHKTDKLYFSFSGGGSSTVSIQFKLDGMSAWKTMTTDETLEDGYMHVIECSSARTKFRVGIENTNYGSGTCVLRLDA